MNQGGERTPPRRLDIRLLGPLDVLVDGRSVAVGGLRPRALLAVLALSAGTGVSTDRLIDTVWDGDPPAGAANSVQVYVSRLRKTVQPAGDPPVLRSVSGGYLLDLPRESVDVLRFEQIAASGHDALGAGDPAEAARQLEQALALWRGPALEDLAGSGTGHLISRLEARRLATQMDLIDARLALGQHADTLPDLEQLVRLHPLDEGLVQRLMTALYLSGRQGDALAAYADASDRLAEELGVDPSPALREVHAQVLRQQLTSPAPAIAELPQPAEPPRPADAQPPARTSSRDARTRELELLLRPRGNLVGRHHELIQALDLLTDPAVRLVSLLGPGGMGKTRLALALAAELNRTAPHGDPDQTVTAVVVPLSMVTDAGELLASIGQSIGADPDRAGQGAFEAIVAALKDRRTVLVLDNLEQLIDAEGTLEDMLGLLDALPDLTILCTSRVALRLGAERQVALGPLSLPAPDATSAEAVLDSDAGQLFVQRARAVAPDFAVTPDNAAAVAEICRLLGGQPLALELAAARTRMLPPAEMLRRTGHLLTLLSGGGRDLPARQRSLRAALDWSTQLLDPAEASVFAEVSVFAGGWTAEAADAVCRSGEPVLDVLGRLVDKSLVVPDERGRLSMLDAVREYAAERLASRPPQDYDAVRDRHAQYFSALADQLGPRFHASPVGSTRRVLQAEAANFVVALDRTAATGQGRLLGEMVFGLLGYWYTTGRIAQSERWVAVALAADLPHDVRVRLRLSSGNLAFVRGDLGAAGEDFEQALAAARDLGDPIQIARTLWANASVARHRGDPTAALGFIDQGLATVATTSAPDGSHLVASMTSILTNERGEILESLGRSTEARAHFEAYRQQSIAADDRGNLAWALANLALNQARVGPPGLARDYARAAIEAADESDSEPVRGDVRAVSGQIELEQGNPVVAVGLLTESIRITHSTGQLLTLADSVSLLGAALLAASDVAGSARMLAAGQAWRTSRGLAVVGALAESAITRAHEQLAGLPVSQLVQVEASRGAAVPFGWIDALELPSVVDLRDPVVESGADPQRVLRLVDPVEGERAAGA